VIIDYLLPLRGNMLREVDLKELSIRGRALTYDDKGGFDANVKTERGEDSAD
jgi:hypothetical protein